MDNRADKTVVESKISVTPKVKDVDAWRALTGVSQTNDISMH